jgi:MOSC domain-containing protein YiiM
VLKIVRLNPPFANVPESEIRHPEQDSVPNGAVVAVSIDGRHRFSKLSRLSITLTSGHGIEGDAHYGAFARHRYLARRNPKAPNLRQVHLIPSELFDALQTSGFEVRPGDLGENIATVGLDLECLPLGTLLRLGASATLELTGLRTPCVLIDRFKSGLKNRLQGGPAGPRFKAGVMAIVTEGGEVSPGDRIRAVLPAPPHLDLPPL